MAYVDKEKFKRKLRYIFKVYRMSEKITEKVKYALDDTTVDVVEVVRCKDCAVPHNEWLGCPNLNGLIPPPDFYCARGERKEK